MEGYLQQELQILHDELAQEHYYKSLEYIFIKHRLYDTVRENLSKLKNKVSQEDLHEAVLTALAPFLSSLPEIPSKQATGQLASLAIKKILCFNENSYTKDLATIEKKQAAVKKDLSNMKKFTIKYLKGLLAKYGELGKRKTQVLSFSKQKKSILKQQTLV